MNLKTTLLLAALAGTLSGCGSLFPKPEQDSARYYVLNSAPAKSVAKEKLRPQVALSVMRLQIPAYLDRAEILRRLSPNRLEILENDLWLEPLGKASTRVFTQDLARKLGTERLALEPALDVYQDALQLQITVLKFDGTFGDSVNLRARWRISKFEDGTTLASGESDIKTPLTDNSPESYVESMSASLETLADKIADEIRKLK